MSDLISREALLEELKNTYVPVSVKLIDLITNAPQQEQVEPVAIVDEVAISWDGKHIFNAVGKVNVGDKLYATPPQPQTVKDALEKAVRICDEHAKQLKEWKAQDYVIGMADTGAMVCANAIRALIEKEK